MESTAFAGLLPAAGVAPAVAQVPDLPQKGAPPRASPGQLAGILAGTSGHRLRGIALVAVSRTS